VQTAAETRPPFGKQTTAQPPCQRNPSHNVGYASAARPYEANRLLIRAPTADNPRMNVRRVLAVLACSGSLLAPASAFAYSVGSQGQVVWVRRAASNFVTAELSGNGQGACAILDAPLRRTQHQRTCARRWNAKLAKLLHTRSGRERLRSQRRAIHSAEVVVHGSIAWIELPTQLMGGQNRFLWTENCWMLQS
jgi:hypothetical protein